MKESLHFKQSRLSNINNQKQKQKKNIHNNLYWVLGVVAKIGNAICRKYYQTLYSFRFFSLFWERRSSC